MSLADALPGHTIDQWAHDLLAAMALPVTAPNVDTLKKWANAESGGYRPGNCVGLYNPLNTTEGHFGFRCQGGSQGNIKGFDTYEQGVQTQAWNLQHTKGAGYESILAALARSDQAAAFSAIDSSSFGTHGLGQSSSSPREGGTGGAGAPAPGGGAPTAGVVSTNPDDDCVLALPGVNLGVASIGGNCLIKTSQARALVGAAALLAGGLVMLAGLVYMGLSTRPGRLVASGLTKGAV